MRRGEGEGRGGGRGKGKGEGEEGRGGGEGGGEKGEEFQTERLTNTDRNRHPETTNQNLYFAHTHTPTVHVHVHVPPPLEFNLYLTNIYRGGNLGTSQVLPLPPPPPSPSQLGFPRIRYEFLLVQVYTGTPEKCLLAHMVLLDLVSDPLLQLEELSLGSPARHLDHKREVAHVQHHGEGLRSASEGEAHLAYYQCIIRYMKKLILCS